MTREEAIARIKDHKVVHKMNEPRAIYISEALDMAIEALEKEPKIGYWIEHPHEAGPCWEYSKYECSECSRWSEDDSDFCPNCGADMREEESEE